jgi:hypothetical protein
MPLKNNFISRAVALVPAIIPYLKAGYYKTFGYMQATITHLVTSVYNGYMGGEFVDILGNLLTGQITQAYQLAWEDDGNTSYFLPDFLQSSLNQMLQQQVNFDWIYQYYKDIIDARVDGTPIAPLLARADLWANRYNEAYNQAVAEIAKVNGGKLKWVEGDTLHKCTTCLALDGIVLYAKEWEQLGVKPQNAPNPMLECDGWNCDCRLEPTSQRRTAKGFDTVLNIIAKI